MTKIILQIPAREYSAIWKHLLLRGKKSEQAAFIYAQMEREKEHEVFRFVEWQAVPEDDFESHSEYHLDLSDDMKAQVIKRAHDLGASIVEFHTHPGPWPAQFSSSDFSGFSEFVPHVIWRLKGRPYGAVVVAKDSFDGLVWRTRDEAPERLHGITVNGRLFEATGLTKLTDYEQSF